MLPHFRRLPLSHLEIDGHNVARLLVRTNRYCIAGFLSCYYLCFVPRDTIIAVTTIILSLCSSKMTSSPLFSDRKRLNRCLFFWVGRPVTCGSRIVLRASSFVKFRILIWSMACVVNSTLDTPRRGSHSMTMPGTFSTIWGSETLVGIPDFRLPFPVIGLQSSHP